MKKKGFTLIELIAVLVIMAIIATIAVPIIYNIKEKSREKSYRISVDNYGHAIELALSSYELEHGDYPNSLDELNIEYSGSVIDCKEKSIRTDGTVYLSECYIDDELVEDKKNADGYYHYGKVLTYYRGDVVSYDDIKFYALYDSDENDTSLTLLKKEPLTVNEVNTYGAGHINTYMDRDEQNYYGDILNKAVDQEGYGAIFYMEGHSSIYDYEHSAVKIVLDNWISDRFDNNMLIADNNGYKAKLITTDDLLDLGCSYNEYYSGSCSNSNYPWMYASGYSYFTMTHFDRSQYGSQCKMVNTVADDSINLGYLRHCSGGSISTLATIRPVIKIKKSAVK